jgi:hypothetical protein
LIMYWFVRPHLRWTIILPWPSNDKWHTVIYCHRCHITLNGFNILTNFEWNSHSLCNLDGTGVVQPLHMVMMWMFQ